jgi:nucleoid DNA-binding protein
MMAVKSAKKPKRVAQKQNFGKGKQTRIEILRSLSDTTGLSKVQVETVFSVLTDMIVSHMRKKGSGEFTIPMTGIKIRRVKKKATKPRKMVSPLTGQEVTIAGKPARHAVKISALKVLKAAVKE